MLKTANNKSQIIVTMSLTVNETNKNQCQSKSNDKVWYLAGGFTILVLVLRAFGAAAAIFDFSSEVVTGSEAPLKMTVKVALYLWFPDG